MNKIKQWWKKFISDNYNLQILFWYVVMLFLLYKLSQWIF